MIASDTARASSDYPSNALWCGVVEAAGRWLPLNLLYVAQAARMSGVEPVLYDAASLFVGWDEIRTVIRERRPRFIGSTAITFTINGCLELGRIAKEELPDTTYILGGVHPTFMWKEILESPGSPVDFIVRSEGEKTTGEFFRHCCPAVIRRRFGAGLWERRRGG